MAFNVNGFVVGGSLPSYADGTSKQITIDRTGALRVSQAGGRWADPARLGLLFTYSTPAAGVTVPIYTSTTQQCVFWNPPGSGVAFQLKKITLGYISGTMVAGHYCLATQTLVTNATSGSQAPLVNSNKLTGNYNATGQNGQKCQLLTAATVVAFTYFRPLQISQVVMTAAAVAAPWIFAEEMDGSIWVMPGGAFAVAANVAAAVVASIAIEGIEFPLAVAA